MKQKLFTSLLLSVIICTTAIAQPVIKAQKTIGGREDDLCYTMYQTKDGGVIAGGSSGSNISGEKSDTSRGGPDYWMVKLNASGNIQWDKTMGGNFTDELTSVQQTSDGGYILGGWSTSNISGEKTENTRGSLYIPDYWIIKLDKFRNIQWDKTIGGSESDKLNSIQQTSDGGYILGGYSISSISSEKTENSRGGYDYWIVKLDSLGNIQWDKTLGGNSNDFLWALQQSSDGGYILGGYSYSNISGEKTENNRGSNLSPDYWVIKLDSQGNIQWDKTIGGSSEDRLSALQQTSNGDYILGGWSDSNISFEKTENSKGAVDYWIVKLDSQGNKKWDKTIGGSDYDYFSSLQETSDKGLILGGRSRSNISGDKTENSRYLDDYWVVKLNKYGKVEWDKTMGGVSINGDLLYSIKQVGPNLYLAGGYSYSGMSGDKTERSRGGADFWLVLLSYTKPIEATTAQSTSDIKSVENNNTKSFTVYPNPAKDILHIQTNGKATFTLTNQSGKILLTKTITNKGEINVAHLPAGFYYLKNNETGAVQKVIISK